MHAAVLARYQEPFAGPCSFTTVASETDVVVAAGVRGSVLLREAESAEFSVVKGRWTQGLLMDSREQVEGRRQAGAGWAPWPVSQRAGSPEHVTTVRHARPRCLVEDGGSRWKFYSLEPSPQSKVTLGTCCHPVTHSRLCGAGAWPEPSIGDSLGCGADPGWHVGPGMSSGSDLAEAYIQFPKLGIGHPPSVGLWDPHSIRFG